MSDHNENNGIKEQLKELKQAIRKLSKRVKQLEEMDPDPEQAVALAVNRMTDIITAHCRILENHYQIRAKE